MKAVQVSALRFACAHHVLNHPNYSIPRPLVSKGTTSEKKKFTKQQPELTVEGITVPVSIMKPSEGLKLKSIFYMKTKQPSHIILSLLLLKFYPSFSSLLLALPELPL